MPDKITDALRRLSYEEPTAFQRIVHEGDQVETALVKHLRYLGIPCGNGPPLPYCTWIPVFSIMADQNPERCTAALTYALATSTDVRQTVLDAAQPGMIVDAIYAESHGEHHLIQVLCDRLMEDDWTNFATLLPSAPEPLGRAVEQGSVPAGTEVRHWDLAGGTELWEGHIAQEKDWMRQFLNMEPGPNVDFRRNLEAASG